MISVINPFQIVIDVCNRLYSDINCSVEFVNDLYDKTKAYGETCWSDDNNIYIQIDVNVPLVGAIEVLAHEIAHVVVGFDEAHGEKWESVFDNINQEFNEYMEKVLNEVR